MFSAGHLHTRVHGLILRLKVIIQTFCVCCLRPGPSTKTPQGEGSPAKKKNCWLKKGCVVSDLSLPFVKTDGGEGSRVQGVKDAG